MVAAGGNSRRRFLVFSPQPCRDGFLDVDESLLLVFPLGDAARQGRTFRNDPAIFGCGQRDVEYHAAMLAMETKRNRAGPGFGAGNPDSRPVDSAGNVFSLRVSARKHRHFRKWAAYCLTFNALRYTLWL